MITISHFRNYWQDSVAQNIPILFLDDNDCENEITKLSNDLLNYFRTVGIGAWKK